MADESLAPMTDWRDRLYERRGLGLPQSWDDYLTANLVRGPAEPDAKPCRPIPCPSFSPDPNDVQLPAFADLLKTSAAEYRQMMRSPVDTSITIYLPQWVVDKLTDHERQLLSDWKMTVRTRYP